MYYEERIVDGVLCWRGTPGGKWTPFTAKQLTQKLQKIRPSWGYISTTGA